MEKNYSPRPYYICYKSEPKLLEISAKEVEILNREVKPFERRNNIGDELRGDLGCC